MDKLGTAEQLEEEVESLRQRIQQEREKSEDKLRTLAQGLGMRASRIEGEIKELKEKYSAMVTFKEGGGLEVKKKLDFIYLFFLAQHEVSIKKESIQFCDGKF
jgi:ABC-type bacteriocin/lantibiotic exporter with double-glycine peptidase domain